MLFSVEEPIIGVRQVPGDLLQLLSIWIRSQPGKLDTPRFQVHHKQQIVGDQPSQTPDFNRREINRRQHGPICLQKLLLACPLFSRWPRFNPICIQHVSDALSRNVITDIGQRPLDSIVTSGGVVFRKPQNQINEFLTQSGTTNPFAFRTVIPFLRNQFTMPTQDGIRRK